MPAGLVNQGVHVYPADTCCVRSQRWRDAGRQVASYALHVFDDAGAGPIEVGIVIEDDVDEREAEEGIPAYDLDVRRGD